MYNIVLHSHLQLNCSPPLLSVWKTSNLNYIHYGIRTKNLTFMIRELNLCGTKLVMEIVKAVKRDQTW